MSGAVWKLEPVDRARREDGKRRCPEEVQPSIEGFIDRHKENLRVHVPELRRFSSHEFAT